MASHKRREKGRIDYLLRIRVNANTQPISVALIEAKKEDELPTKGLDQAKKYARLNHVYFIFSSNGRRFVEYDSFTGKTSPPKSMSEFPSPLELRIRVEQGLGISFEDEKAKPLLVPYPKGEASRRYYQDAAIRAALEKLQQAEKGYYFILQLALVKHLLQ